MGAFAGMRIIYLYQGKEEAMNFDRVEVLVGRLSPLSSPDLDLSIDPTVSRKHARIRHEGEQYWIEDLKSTNGTMVNGAFVLKSKLDKESVVRLGETVLKVEAPVIASAAQAPAVSAPVRPPATPAVPKIDGMPQRLTPAPVVAAAAKAPNSGMPMLPPIGGEAMPPIGGPPKAPPAAAAPVVPSGLMPKPASMTTTTVTSTATQIDAAGADFRSRLGQLYDLPLQYSTETRLDTLLQMIVQRVINLIPGTQRGALLLQDRVKDKLQLRASVPPGEVVVSETLARRVMTEGHGFILERSTAGGAALDTKLVKLETGMYAPLLLKEKPLGALYVDSPGRTTPFSEDDMQFLLAASHFVALMIHNHQLQEDLKHNSTLLERVSTKFPPAIQERLLDSVRHGLLRPGGGKSEVTVLFSDLRDFNSSSAKLGVTEVVQMLNEYFPALVEAIFRYGGTIDKFAGDAIVAVFGSPEPDPQQQEKAVRAALAMLGALKELNARRTAKGAPILEIGIGVHGGAMLNGFFGAAERMEFTVVGESLGLAALLCKGARDGELLIAPEVYQKVFKIVETERIILPNAFGEQNAYRVKGLHV
jgi:adenylate cyclase